MEFKLDAIFKLLKLSVLHSTVTLYTKMRYVLHLSQGCYVEFDEATR